MRSHRSILPYFAFTAHAMLPSKDDWQVKIDKVVDEYLNKTIHLPRKAKKQRRKELLASYNFYKSLQNYDPFKI